MLIEKNFVIEIDSEDSAKEKIEKECNFVTKLIGIYFVWDSKKPQFDAKYVDNKLYLYFRENMRAFLNPVIIIEFSKKYINVLVRYNKVNSVTVSVISLILIVMGFAMLFFENFVWGFLPLAAFWIIVFISFTFSCKKIEKRMKEILNT